MSNRKQTTTGRIPRKVKANMVNRFNNIQLDTYGYEKKEEGLLMKTKPHQAHGSSIQN